jgi:hypothetical protein
MAHSNNGYAMKLTCTPRNAKMRGNLSGLYEINGL